jgi:hypothetical protein
VEQAASPGTALLRTRGRRAWAPWLPVPRLRSDVAPALYVNWLAATDRVAPFVPAPLELQRVGPGGRFAVLTVVAFRHGHFGPQGLGPLRRLAPSPVQSNWRTYVVHPATGRAGVHFLTTTVSNPLYRLAARLTADNVPMRPCRGRPRRTEERVECHLRHRGATVLRGNWTVAAAPSAGPWSPAFPSWDAMLDFVVPQDAALAVRDGRVARIELRLGIPRDQLQALEGPVACPPFDGLAASAPWAFWVPAVDLRYERQRWDG